MSLLDLRHVLRGLKPTPVFTIVTLLTLALAIGANTAVFSLVDQTLLRPLPYLQSDRLVAIWADLSSAGLPRNDWTNPADFADWSEQSTGIEDMVAYGGTRPALTGMGDARQLFGGSVTHSFFDVFGARMQIGRGFGADEDVPNGPDVAVISHATGLLLGLAMAAGLSRSFGALLYDVHPMDPSVVVGVASLLLAVALVATLVPAWRAARTQPMRVLREE